MTEISDAERRDSTKSVLQLQAPSLVLRGVHLPSRDRYAWRKETWSRRLNLCECLSSREGVNKRRIRNGCLLIQTGCLIGRQVVSYHCERVQEWGIAGKA